MTLEQLRVFIAVAERQHMTRAASALGLSQSAVSSTIKALEASLALVLFDRVGRRIELTQAGGLLLEEARAVLARAQAAEARLRELSQAKQGVLVLQSSRTIAGYWLPKHLARYRELYPGIDVRVAVANTRQVAAAIAQGTAELGFVEGAISDPQLLQRTVATDKLVLVVGRGHPWVQRRSVRAAELSSTDWVLREVGSGTRAAFEAALESHQIPIDRIRVALELPSNGAIRSAVESGAGATVISELVVDASLRAGTLHRVQFAFAERAFRVLRHSERRRSVAAEALLALLRT